MATELSTLVISVESAEVTEAADRLRNLAAASGQADAATATNVNTQRRYQQTLRDTNGQMRFLPVQLQQIGQQLILGQPAWQVAIQQGGDLNAALGGRGLRGTISALAGSFASLLNPVSLATIGIIAFGGTIAQAFSETEQGADRTRTAFEFLEESVSALSQSNENTLRSARELREEYGQLSNEARRFFELRQEFDEAEARRRLRGALGDLGEREDSLLGVGIEELRREINETINEAEILARDYGITNVRAQQEAIANLIEGQLESLAGRFDITNESAQALRQFFIDIENAEGLEAQRQVLSQIISQFADGEGGIANMSEKARTLYNELLSVFDAMLQITNQSSLIQEAFRAATAEVEGARTALQRTRIEANFGDAPVQRAGALARFDFGQGVDTSNFDTLERIGFENLREQAGQAAEEAARFNEATRENNELQREQERLQRRINRERDRSSQYIQGLGEENNLLQRAVAIGNENVFNLREEVALRRAIARLGENATQEQIEAVRQLVTENQRLTETYREQLEQQRFNRQTFTGFFSDLNNNIRQGQSFWEAFGNAGERALNRILDRMVDLAANQAFDQLFGGAGGGFSPAAGTGLGSIGLPPALARTFSPQFQAAASGNATGLFQSGGYTGSGPRNQPAGIVHGQEFVVNAAATQRNRAALEAINSGANVSGSGQQRTQVIINNNSGEQARAERQEVGGEEIITVTIGAVESAIRGGRFDEALNDRYGNDVQSRQR